MPNPKLIALVTALLLLGGNSRALADYSLEQLRAIELLILSKNSAGLGDYLVAHPQMTAGSDALAVELRAFLRCSRSGTVNCFDAVIADKGTAVPPAAPEIAIY